MLKDLKQGWHIDVLTNKQTSEVIKYYDDDYIIVGSKIYKNDEALTHIGDVANEPIGAFTDEDSRLWIANLSSLYVINSSGKLLRATLSIYVIKILFLQDDVLYACCQGTSSSSIEGTSLRKIKFSITDDALVIESNEMIYSDKYRTTTYHDRLFYYNNNIYWYEYTSSYTQDRTSTKRYNINTEQITTIKTPSFGGSGSYPTNGVVAQDPCDPRYIYIMGSTLNKTQKIDLETLSVEKEYDYVDTSSFAGVCGGIAYSGYSSRYPTNLKVFDLEAGKYLFDGADLFRDYQWEINGYFETAYYGRLLANKKEIFIPLRSVSNYYSKSIYVVKILKKGAFKDFSLKENVMFDDNVEYGNQSIEIIESCDEITGGNPAILLKENAVHQERYKLDFKTTDKLPPDYLDLTGLGTFPFSTDIYVLEKSIKKYFSITTLSNDFKISFRTYSNISNNTSYIKIDSTTYYISNTSYEDKTFVIEEPGVHKIELCPGYVYSGGYWTNYNLYVDSISFDSDSQFVSNEKFKLKENILFKSDENSDTDNLALLEDVDNYTCERLDISLKESVNRTVGFLMNFKTKIPTNTPWKVDISNLYKGFYHSTSGYIYSNSIGHAGKTNSYIKFEAKANTIVSIKARASSEQYDYGSAHVTTSEDAPLYTDATNRFVFISGSQSSFSTYTYTIPADGTYYLHLAYSKDYNGLGYDDRVYFTDIVLPCNYETESFDNSFTLLENILFSGDELYGDLILNLSEVADETTGGELYASLKEDVRRDGPKYTFDFENKVPTSSPSTIDITQLYKGFIYDETNKCIYNIELTSSGTTANSYIKFQAKTGDVVSLKAKISSGNYGYAHVTTTITEPVYSTTIGRFVYFAGTTDWKEYTYTIPADGAYYLHLGLMYNSSTSYERRVYFTDIKLPITVFEAFNNAFNLLDNVIAGEQGHALIALKENAIDATPGDALLPQQESIWAQENSDLALDEKACEAGFIDGFNLIEKAYRSEASGLALKEKAYTQEVNGFDVKEKVFETLYIRHLDLKEATYQGYDYYLALKERTQAQENVLLPLIQMTYAGSGYNSLNLALTAYIKAFMVLPIAEYIIALPGVNFALYETINKQDGKSVYLLEHIRHPYLNMYEHIHADGYKTQLVNSSRNLIPINRNGATR